jgi:hypothetical protein
MTQQMDMIRKLFLEKQLAILPADVIGIIREYDGQRPLHENGVKEPQLRREYVLG